MLYDLRDLLQWRIRRETSPGEGVWIAAAPPWGSGRFGQRLRAAWLVLLGKADAFLWPDPKVPRTWCLPDDRPSLQTPTRSQTEGARVAGPMSGRSGESLGKMAGAYRPETEQPAAGPMPFDTWSETDKDIGAPSGDPDPDPFG